MKVLLYFLDHSNMRKKLKSVLLISLACLLGSCGGTQDPNSTPDNPDTPNNPNNPDNPDNPDTPDTPDDPDVPDIPEPGHEYVSLDEAIKNTKEYTLKAPTIDGSFSYIECNTEEGYYYTYTSSGYVLTDEDPDYYHYCEVNFGVDDSLEMAVYGRNYKKSEKDKFSSRNVISTLKPYLELFEKENDNTYHISYNSDYIWDLANFFNSHLIKYATDSYLIIGEDDRLQELAFYEIYGEECYKTVSYVFTNETIKDMPAYLNWVEKGSFVHNRISDIKASYNGVSLYENDEISLSNLVLTSFDSDGNAIAAEVNNVKGPLGINIGNVDKTGVEIGDVIDIKGTVKSTKHDIHFEDTVITKISKKPAVLPYFEEDCIEPTYGAGAYAAQIFMANKLYCDSVYSTFAYVKSIKEESDKTQATIIFPNTKIGQYALTLQFVIKNNLKEEVRTSLIEFLNSVIKYGEGGADCIYFEKVLTKFTDENVLYLEATEFTHLEHRKDFKGLLEKHLGIENFPLISNFTETQGYKFGGISGLFIEDNYGGYKENNTVGVFGSFSGFREVDYYDYLTKLESFGLVKFNEVRDLSKNRHILFTKGTYVFDVMFSTSNSNTISLYVYEGEMIRGKLLAEKIDELNRSYITSADVPLLQDTFDAEYDLYTLDSYANKDYSDEPLMVVTCDLTSDFASNYLSKYGESFETGYKRAIINAGYTTYRKGDGSTSNPPLTQKVRGQTQYYYHKGDTYFAFSVYPTSDYTYTNHKNFDDRIEIIIYKGDGPLQITHHDDLITLTKLYKDIDESLVYTPKLPSDSVVEVWKDLNDLNSSTVTYGYGTRDEAFVYTKDVDGAFDAMVEAVESAGYEFNFGGSWSKVYHKTYKDRNYFVCFFKETRDGKSYLRVMQDLGGIDFWETA